jgi:hypothetical protein
VCSLVPASSPRRRLQLLALSSLNRHWRSNLRQALVKNGVWLPTPWQNSKVDEVVSPIGRHFTPYPGDRIAAVLIVAVMTVCAFPRRADVPDLLAARIAVPRPGGRPPVLLAPSPLRLAKTLPGN